MSSSGQSSVKVPVCDPSDDHPRGHSSRDQQSHRTRSQSGGKEPVQEPSSGQKSCQASDNPPVQEPVRHPSSPKSPAQEFIRRKSSNQSSVPSPAHDHATVSLFEHFYRRLVEEEQQRANLRRQIEHELEQISTLRAQLNKDAIRKRKVIIQLDEDDNKAAESRRLLAMHPSSRNSSISHLSSRTSSVGETSTSASSVSETPPPKKSSQNRYFKFDHDNRKGASNAYAKLGSTSQDQPSPKSIMKPRSSRVSFQLGGDSSSESSSAVTSPESLPKVSKIILPKPVLLDGQADTPSASQIGSPEPIPAGPGVLGPVDHAVCCLRIM
jgi:hypothetical protein